MKPLKVVRKFFPTLKKYIDYLMKVGYKELLINTVIIFCIIVISLFVYVPVDLVRDFLKDTFEMFASMPLVLTNIYNWIFMAIELLLSFYCFMYMFNLRFESINNKENNSTKDDKKKNNKNNNDELDLPKAKDN